jgi:hypothetical protein
MKGFRRASEKRKGNEAKTKNAKAYRNEAGDAKTHEAEWNQKAERTKAKNKSMPTMNGRT